MNAQSFVSLTANILATGLSLFTTEAPQFVITSMSNNIFNNSSQTLNAFTPSRRGTPRGREGGGSRFAPPVNPRDYGN
jgi:hypothetical protein